MRFGRKLQINQATLRQRVANGFERQGRRMSWPTPSERESELIHAVYLSEVNPKWVPEFKRRYSSNLRKYTGLADTWLF